MASSRPTPPILSEQFFMRNPSRKAGQDFFGRGLCKYFTPAGAGGEPPTELCQRHRRAIFAERHPLPNQQSPVRGGISRMVGRRFEPG
jgi:hypothetical protein